MNNPFTILKEFFRMRTKKELLIRIFELVFGYPLYALSFLMIRQKNKWCFGTNVGFTDNSKYMFLYVNEQKNGIRPIWISQSDEDILFIRNLGFEAYKKYSLKGLYHCLTSHVYVFTYHSKDINFFTSGNVKKVNLWHGVGIKGGSGGKKANKIASKNANSIITRITLPHLFEKYDLFLSTSDMMNSHFIDMFSLKKDIVFDCIYPRCYYMAKSTEDVIRNIEKYESITLRKLINRINSYSKICLYMPTWRGDLSDDFITTAGFDFYELNKQMTDSNTLFIFKLHPAVRLLNSTHLEHFSNIIFLDKRLDIYPILSFTNILITDYSSIYYDFVLLNKGVILYPFDKEEFLESSNDLAFDYDEFTPGRRVKDVKELIAVINSQESLTLKHDDRVKIIESFWGKCNINNLHPLYIKIQSL